MSTEPNDQGKVRPFIRVLAVIPAALIWWFFFVVISDFNYRRAVLQDYWVIVLSLFMASFFTVAVVRGRVPRWLYRCIPHTWGWR